MKRMKIFMLDHRTYCINSLGDALAQEGHQITYQSSWKLKEIENGIAYFKPDILITVGYNRALFRFMGQILGLCQKYGLFHLYWATEDLINHTDWSLPFVQCTKPDLVWTIHPACIEKYKRMGIDSSYFNFAFNPRIFPEKKRDEHELYNISFIGATHLFKETYRFESLKQLLFPLVERGEKTNVWGLGWKKENSTTIKGAFGCVIPDDWLHGHILYGNTPSVYRQSKIVLGIQNAKDQVSQRTFEILGSGAFMITNKTEAITRMFKDKQELVTTDAPEETIKLIKYYLGQPKLRYEIGCNARRKVMNQYTYHHQLTRLWPMVERLSQEKKRRKVIF